MLSIQNIHPLVNTPLPLPSNYSNHPSSPTPTENNFLCFATCAHVQSSLVSVPKFITDSTQVSWSPLSLLHSDSFSDCKPAKCSSLAVPGLVFFANSRWVGSSYSTTPSKTSPFRSKKAKWQVHVIINTSQHNSKVSWGGGGGGGESCWCFSLIVGNKVCDRNAISDLAVATFKRPCPWRHNAVSQCWPAVAAVTADLTVAAFQRPCPWRQCWPAVAAVTADLTVAAFQRPCPWRHNAISQCCPAVAVIADLTIAAFTRRFHWRHCHLTLLSSCFHCCNAAKKTLTGRLTLFGSTNPMVSNCSPKAWHNEVGGMHEKSPWVACMRKCQQVYSACAPALSQNQFCCRWSHQRLCHVGTLQFIANFAVIVACSDTCKNKCCNRTLGVKTDATIHPPKLMSCNWKPRIA